MSEPALDVLLDEEVELEALLWADIRGDREARGEALELVLPKVLRVIQRRFGGKRTFDADDAVASAVRTLERRGWPANPTSWEELAAVCIRYAINKGLTKLRWEQRKREVSGHASADEDGQAGFPDLAAAQDTACEAAIRQEMRAAVQEVLSELNHELDETNCIILRGKYDELRYVEIKRLLAKRGDFLDEDAIRKRWERIKKHLQRTLDGFQPTDGQ